MGWFIVLCILYWLAVAGILLIGLIKLGVSSSKNEPVKPALRLIIISLVMLVIGVGACAAILTGM
jgi:hypothetical protein